MQADIHGRGRDCQRRQLFIGGHETHFDCSFFFFFSIFSSSQRDSHQSGRVCLLIRKPGKCNSGFTPRSRSVCNGFSVSLSVVVLLPSMKANNVLTLLPFLSLSFNSAHSLSQESAVFFFFFFLSSLLVVVSVGVFLWWYIRNYYYYY